MVKRRYVIVAAFTIVLLLVAIIISVTTKNSSNKNNDTVQVFNSVTKVTSVDELISGYAKENDIDISEYPDSMVKLLKKNDETRDFVLSYPIEKDAKHIIDRSEYKNAKSVPLLMQWDKRWGYIKYGNDVAGITGCGPTTLSMVAIYVLQNPKYTPDYMLKYSLKHGYCSPGHGSLWTLISKGGRDLGINVKELPLNKDAVMSNLKMGKPIVCIMGPGDFTDGGHYIAMVGTKDGKIKINDCNSKKNSQKLWEFDDIKDQIKNLWLVDGKI